MDLLQVLSASPATWASEVAALDDRERAQLGEWLAREWIEDRLEPRLLTDDDAVDDDEARRTLRRQLAATLTALEMDHLAIEWGDGWIDATAAARWCWVTPWRIDSDSEDILLRKEHLIEPLLREAAANCPKRRYVLNIVAAHVRLQAYLAVEANPATAGERFASLLELRGLLRDARANDTAEYLDRLESYIDLRGVDEREARARILDLWPSMPPLSLIAQRRASELWAQMESHPATERWIVIDQKTGLARVESPGRDRQSAKGRHGAR